jgi:hypothetical protein
MKSELKQRVTIILLLSALTTAPIFSQLGFYEGYIVTNQNDTLFGKVGIGQNTHIIEYCIFKNETEDIKYYSDKIKRFGFTDGACYVSNVLKDTIVQVLVDGRLSLYRLQSTFYVQKTGEKANKLHTYTEKVVSNDQVYYVESVKWKGVITYLTSDCTPGPDVIGKLHLLERELTELVVNYNKCTKSGFTEYKSK